MEKTCRFDDCSHAAGVDELCAFHHLSTVAEASLFSHVAEGLPGLSGEAFLEALFLLNEQDLAELDEDELIEFIPDEPAEPAIEYRCSHGMVLGTCILSQYTEGPGLGYTVWELRAQTNSWAIPLS